MVADEPPEDVLRVLRNLADRIEDVSISDEEAGEHSQMLTDVWRLPGTGIEIDSQRIGLSLRGIKNWWTLRIRDVRWTNVASSWSRPKCLSSGLWLVWAVACSASARLWTWTIVEADVRNLVALGQWFTTDQILQGRWGPELGSV